MPPGLLSALVQIAIALIASGVAVKLLTLRQDRRKIAGEASTNEANAASTLSGAALQMVEAAQNTAREAEARAAAAHKRAEDCQEDSERLWSELNKTRWQIHWLEMREKVLEAALSSAGISVPSRPDPVGEFPPHAPPPISPPGPPI